MEVSFSLSPEIKMLAPFFQRKQAKVVPTTLLILKSIRIISVFVLKSGNQKVDADVKTHQSNRLHATDPKTV